jgi:AcrR family transcriptional regulator
MGKKKQEIENPKIDRRIKYTRMVLKQSLLKLMETRPINKITVKELCDLADINRSTFYTYYVDPFDLLRQIEQELFDKIAQTTETVPVTTDEVKLLQEIFQSLYENGELCRVIFSEFGDKEFIRKVINVAYKSCIERWSRYAGEIPKKQLGWIYEFIANGIAGIIQNWIQSGMKESPQEMAIFINHLYENGLRGYLK